MPRRRKRSLFEYHTGVLVNLGFWYALHALETGTAIAWHRGFLADPTSHVPALMMLGAPALIPLILAFGRALPRFLSAPSRWYHVPSGILAIICLTGFGDFVVTGQGLAAGLTAQQMMLIDSDFLPMARIALFLAFIVTSILCVRSGGSTPQPGAIAPAMPARAAPRPRSTVPQVNALMRILGLFDWVGPRLLGLALLGTAWMLWGFVRDGRTERAADLAYGLEPMYAIGAYVAAGALLALPFLMTSAIAQPRHVGGGMAKAALIGGAAYFLMAPLRLAIMALVDDLHRPLVLAAVPPLVMVLVGLTVISAPVLAFFRQLGTLEPHGTADKTGPVMDVDTLRELRLARMQS